MNKFIIADPNLCIGCHACEIACVMAHNDGQHVLTEELFRPRIFVVQDENRQNAVTCHQCDDAPCLMSCPNHAISKVNHSIQIDQSRCIGCKSCEVACPFGVIEVSTVTLADGAKKAQALKCDLCITQTDGPACIANCPTQALQLISDQTLDELAQKRRRLRAIQSLQPWHGESNEAGHESAIHSDKIAQLKHTDTRHDPDKIPLQTRKTTFEELYLTFSPKQAHQQSERCLKCGEHSICEWSCPLHNHIPQWIELVKEGRIMEAVELSHQTNCMPEITGRICPQDRLCESRCTLKETAGSVTVGNIERFISEQAFASGWRPDLSDVTDTGRNVAIIGAGPAGLGCADILARNGVHATVFDRHPEIGGLLTFGIPSFKLDKTLLARRREIFSYMGIEFRLNCEVGRDISLAQLLNDFDAVFVGVGTYKSMQVNLPNDNAPGVYDALPYLIANTKHVMGLPELPEEPYTNLEGQHVVVLGGGDTAMDCVRTALRQNAKQVTCAYRRDETNMPGSKKEVKNAKEEGAQFEFYVQPLGIELDDKGSVSGIRMQRTQLGEPDSSGRRRPKPIPGSEFVMPADAIIIAFGFLSHDMPWLTEQGVKLNKWGEIIAHVDTKQPFQTSHPKIFAGGDAVHGADLVVTAMADGRHAADGILSYLELQ